MKRFNPMRTLTATALTLGSVLAFAESNPQLPAPYSTPSVRHESTPIGWPAGKAPIAPAGYKVSVFANIKCPRSLFLLPDGKVLVSQAKKSPSDSGELSPNLVTVLRPNGDRLAVASTAITGLKLPFGMALWKDQFFVAEANRVLKFKFADGRVQGVGQVIAYLPFPKPQRHWTRHLLVNADGTKLYVSIGSVSNVGEAPDPLDARNAAILEMNLDGTGQKLFATGLRNPVSMAWEPVTGELWAVVNERDELGDNLVPDYITHVQRGGFYGWPYAYWGSNPDPRLAGQRPDLIRRTIVPDYAVGAHTAALGITFTNGLLPAPFGQGALVAQHGSWNRSQWAGYKVIYVPFEGGKAVGPDQDFLTGFIADEAKGTVYGRPVATLLLKDGSVLVSDDGGHKIWRVSPLASPLAN